MRHIQIETLTLHDGSKVEAIRDIEAVRRMAKVGGDLHEWLLSLDAWKRGVDIPNSVFVPFAEVFGDNK